MQRRLMYVRRKELSDEHLCWSTLDPRSRDKAKSFFDHPEAFSRRMDDYLVAYALLTHKIALPPRRENVFNPCTCDGKQKHHRHEQMHAH